VSQIKFIPFQPKYKNNCLELFKSNIDGYFSPIEVDDFKCFLQQLSAKDHYYVGLIDAQIIACGGWENQPKGYFLRWGLIEHSHHKRGLGRQLLIFRLNKMAELYGSVDIFIRTSKKAHGFFKKFGFEVYQVIVDGIVDGIDEYQLKRPAPAKQRVGTTNQ